MGRRDGVVTIDLEPAEEFGDEPGSAPGVEHGARSPEMSPGTSVLADPFGSLRRAAVRRPKRFIVATAGAIVVIALVIGTTATIERNRERAAELALADAVLATAGGVRDVTGGPLTEAWSTGLTGSPLGALPGTVVVADGADIVGISVTDGTEMWRHEIGGQVDCGQFPPLSMGPFARAPQPSTTLVCVAGPPQARRVAVVGADGTLMAQRDLGDTSGMTVLPTPDGGLVVVSETRDDLQWADIATGEPLDPSSDTATTYFFGSGDGRFSIRNSGRLGALAGPDTVVAVVDAATGAQRWTATIPFEPIADISGCVVLSWVVVPDAGSGEATGTSQAGGLSLQVTAWLSAPIIQINRCSQSFTFLLDGTQIRPSVLAERLAGDGSVVIDPDGGFLFTDAATGIAVLLDEQGVPRFTRTEADRRAWNTQFGLPLVAVPAAPGLADDPSGLSGLRLGFQGGKFTGFALDGSIRWVGAKLPAARSGTGPANTTVNKVLARVGTIGLVATGRNDELAAFDLTDGSLRWVQPAPEAVRAGDVVRAVTDGRTVVLLSTHFEPAPVGSAVQQYVLSYELTGIDLATGDMWSLPQEPGVPVDFVVVDGHVLAYYGSTAVEPWAVTVVADGPFAGETVIPQDGRLALLVPDEDPG